MVATIIQPSSTPVRPWLVGLGALLLAGCAVSNEGAVDYRKADAIDPAPVGIAALAPAAGSDTAVVPAQAQAVTRIVAPAMLERKALPHADANAAIEKGDSIAIRLRTAYLKDFEAIIGHPLRGFRPNGEIAIVVRAFEYGNGEDFNFGPDAVREGRLVFYSPDVDKGQILNFDNLPVYGPITYNGNPIGLDISVIEIDADNAQIDALLGTLATLGAQVYPPAAPALPVLNALGKALLNGGTNDTEMRFTLLLDPAAGYEGVHHPRVEAGDYVFVREENRTAKTPWHELIVDANDGRVYRGGAPYADATYLTFQINKNLSSTDIDLSQNTFGRFLDEIEQEDARRAEDLEPFLSELRNLGFTRVQTRQFGEARDLLTDWQNARKKGNTSEAKRAAAKLVGLMQAALQAPDATPPQPPALSAEQINYLLDKLAVMADAGGRSDLNLFTPDGFKNADLETVFAAVQAGQTA